MSQKKYKFIKSKYTVSVQADGFFKRIPTFFLFLFIVGIVSYIGLTNHISSQVFVLRDLESRAEELRNENESLELRAHELTTSTLVEDRLGHLPLVKVSDIEYLSPTLSQVAVR